MHQEHRVVVYVELLEEGTDTYRPTQGIVIREGVVELLPTENYNPDSEVWAFLPGTVVECKETYTDTGKPILLAIKQVE